MSPPDRRDRDADPPEKSQERVMRRFFEKLDAKLQEDPPPAPAAPAPRPRPPATQSAKTQQSLPALPVAPADVPPPSAPPSKPPEVPAPAPPVSKRTEPVPQMTPEAWAQRGALPFRPAFPGEPPYRRGPKTQASRVAGLEPGGTTPTGDDIKKAIAALPFPRIRSLTVQQYVSLCVDLEVWPAHANETRRRYGVRDEVAQRLLDAHWQEKLSRSAELRAERDAAEATYRSWLRKASG